jgi:hypothetical protein
MGPWYKGCINQVWDTVLEPNSGLVVYIWINGRVRLYERRPRNHNQYRYVRRLHHSTFPLKCVPISGQFHSVIFHASAYTTMTKPRATIPEHILER